MEEFIKQKADGFDNAYEKRDAMTFNSLLTEYLMIYEKLPAEGKKTYTNLLGAYSDDIVPLILEHMVPLSRCS